MAIAGNIVVGMSANVNSFIKDMKKGAAGLHAFAGAAVSAKGALIGIGGATALAGIIKASESASDLNEQISKSKTVFGSAASVVDKAATQMGDAWGYPKKEFYDAASSIGLIAKASGLTQAAAASMGAEFARTAADAASFYNVPLDEAMAAIRSGLVGEAEPMRRFGVLLNAAAVDAKAAEMGFKKLNGAYSEGAKVQARAALITRGLADAQGDLARTSGSAANQVRSVWGRLENLGADLGTAIQPVTDKILILANSALKVLSDEITRNKDAIAEWAAEAASSNGSVVTGFKDLGAVVGFVADAWQVFMQGIRFGRQFMLEFIRDTLKGMDWVNKAGENAVKWLTGFDISNGGSDNVSAFADEFAAAAEKAHDAFKAGHNEEWISSDVTSVFEKTADLANKTAEAVAGAGDAGAKMGEQMGDAATKVGAVGDKIEKLEKDLKASIATFGMSSEVAGVYKLKLEGATDAQLQGLTSLAMQHDGMEKAKKAMEDAETPADKYRKKMDELAKVFRSGTLTQEQFGKVAKDSAKEFSDDLLTPMEKYAQKVKELEDLFKVGAITQSQFDRGKRLAGKEAKQDEPTQFAGALQLGSAEARSSLLRFAAGPTEDDALQELADVGKQSLDVEHQILLALQRNPAPAGAQAVPQPFNF